jgi:hypothetical protein
MCFACVAANDAIPQATEIKMLMDKISEAFTALYMGPWKGLTARISGTADRLVVNRSSGNPDLFEVAYLRKLTLRHAGFDDEERYAREWRCWLIVENGAVVNVQSPAYDEYGNLDLLDADDDACSRLLDALSAAELCTVRGAEALRDRVAPGMAPSLAA